MISVSQRRKIILDHVDKSGYMQVADLASLFSVTQATIRSDLAAMESEGLLYRVHGSAMSKSHIARERSTNDKRTINAEAKERIGKKALELIADNDSIFIAAGSTVLAFCEQIPPEMHLTVVTPSIQIAALLSPSPNISVHLLGGIVHHQSLSVRGEYSDGVLDTINCATFFFGADGIDENGIITCSTVEEALFMKKAFNCAMKTVLLCDSSKIGKSGIGRICDMKKLDAFITDKGISKSYKKKFEADNVDVVTV